MEWLGLENHLNSSTVMNQSKYLFNANAQTRFTKIQENRLDRSYTINNKLQ